ncbi:glycine/sarcosine/betaine reductase selenoprotein B family protein [Fusibacter sp. JL298sf-3]
MQLKMIEKFLKFKVDRKFKFVDNRNIRTPYAPLEKPLSKLKIGVVTSSGIYVEGEEPFDTEDSKGDATFRVVPHLATHETLRIAHTHYDHKYIEADLNVAVPFAHLEDFKNDGCIGGIAESHISISGFILKTDQLINDTSAAIAEHFKRQKVDAVLLAPV